MTRTGFPHSDISGSMHICCSPKLIAAYRVLHRLPMPRHSPCALFRLNYSPLAFANFVPYMSFANRFFFANCNTITCCTEKPFYTDSKLSFLLVSTILLSSSDVSTRLDLSSLSIFSFQSTSQGFPCLVGSNGFEPSTSRLSGARSNQLSYEPISVLGSFPHVLPLDSRPSGGDEGIRTLDPLLAGQVLSQLSYTPISLDQRGLANPQN